MTNEIVIAGDVMFRPRFDNVSRDCERLMERVVELTHQGQLQRQEGKSLFDLYIKDAERRLIDAFLHVSSLKRLKRITVTHLRSHSAGLMRICVPIWRSSYLPGRASGQFGSGDTIWL